MIVDAQARRPLLDEAWRRLRRYRRSAGKCVYRSLLFLRFMPECFRATPLLLSSVEAPCRLFGARRAISVRGGAQ